MQITNVKCPENKYSIKCPYEMTPEYITVHNTYNDASAMAEISYMLGNNLKTSFHVAVDNERVVKGIPFTRNAWHSGDGHGKGNMKSIGIEICYSKSGGERFDEAEELAAEYIAYLLKQYGWGILESNDALPLATRMGNMTSLAPHEWLPELAVVPREKTHTGAASREKSPDDPVIAR